MNRIFALIICYHDLKQVCTWLLIKGWSERENVGRVKGKVSYMRKKEGKRERKRKKKREKVGAKDLKEILVF